MDAAALLPAVIASPLTARNNATMQYGFTNVGQSYEDTMLRTLSELVDLQPRARLDPMLWGFVSD